MHIFEIIKPGTWLDYEDRDWSWKIEGILRSLEGQFYEANLALNLFSNSIEINRPSHVREDWESDSNRRSEIRKEIEKKYSNQYDHSVHEEIHFETEVIFKREKWKSGKLPREFQHNESFIYARAFLYSLDSFDKFLKVLKSHKDAPNSLADIYEKFGESFIDLRGVRNSSQHMEDRSRGLGAGRNPKPLELKPIDNGFIKADGGALVLNSLNGTKYGNTMSDGHYGEIDVSPVSMEKLHSIFQEVLNTFNWKGPKGHLPST